MKINFRLNGEPVSVDTDPAELMVDVLRLRFNLRGARPGCLQGQCGSCLIVFNHELSPSCMIPAFRAYGSEIMTLEGLMQTREFTDIERGFERAGAYPCRFCAAGKFLSVHMLLQTTLEPTEQQIADTISGVHCRCTVYERLATGIENAARLRRRRAERGQT
jgi:aerobic carbon-monoxide dehydrogenase small subunit